MFHQKEFFNNEECQLIASQLEAGEKVAMEGVDLTIGVFHGVRTIVVTPAFGAGVVVRLDHSNLE